MPAGALILEVPPSLKEVRDGFEGLAEKVGVQR